MTEIDKINDKIFKKAFGSKENVKTFLQAFLDEPLRERIDFSAIKIAPTNLVSQEFNEYFSDIVVNTNIRSKDGGKLPADICIIFEHKTTPELEIFIQLLGYMVEKWRKDTDAKRPLRVIIPIVFYHGAREWKIPEFFADQFDVDDEVKKYLLNYRYILFDTNRWDFRAEGNETLKENVFMLTSLVLMKCAYTGDMDTIREITRLWYERGFTGEIKKVVFFLRYISQTQGLGPEEIKEMLDKSKIDGGKIMQTWMDDWKDEARKEGLRKGRREGLKEGKLETAERMLNDGFSLKDIAKYTKLTKKEIEKLKVTTH